jgi:DNA-binding MurR/RpiR family transcriptional regulator
MSNTQRFINQPQASLQNTAEDIAPKSMQAACTILVSIVSALS